MGKPAGSNTGPTHTVYEKLRRIIWEEHYQSFNCRQTLTRNITHPHPAQQFGVWASACPRRIGFW